VAVKGIKLGQVWRQDSSGQDYLVTKVYSEVFSQFAVLRPAEVTAPDAPIVKVKVAKSGVSVRHRRGYYATDPENWKKASGEDLKNALARNDADSSSVLFYARALPPSPNSEVKVEFLVDTHTVSFGTTNENQRYCNLEFQVQAYTQDGKLAKAEVQQAEAPLKPETYARIEKSGLPMPISIKLLPGKYMLRLGVRDNRTGLFGTTELPLNVADPTK